MIIALYHHEFMPFGAVIRGADPFPFDGAVSFFAVLVFFGAIGTHSIQECDVRRIKFASLTGGETMGSEQPGHQLPKNSAKETPKTERLASNPTTTLMAT